MNKYDQLSREELIHKLEQLEDDNAILLQQCQKDTQVLLFGKESIRQAIGRLLTTLLDLSIEDKIDQALRVLLNFFNADRAYIAWYDEVTEKLNVTDEVTQADIFSVVSELPSITKDDISWWYNCIMNGKDIIINDINDMPPEASFEKEILEMQDIVSLMVLPLFQNRKPCGFIGLDLVNEKRNWSTIERENLRTLGDIISISMQHREMYQKTLQSELEFRELYNNMPICYFYKRLVRDEQGNPIDFEYLDVNKATEVYFGISRQNFIGKNYREVMAPKLSEDVFDLQLMALQSNIPTMQERIIFYDNTVFKITSYSPCPDHLVTLCINLSSTEQMDEEILKSETKFKIVFDNLSVGVELYDLEGYLLDMNAADERIFHVKLKDVKGVNLFENPNLPQDQMKLLRQGQEVDLQIEYTYAKVHEYNYFVTECPDKVVYVLIRCIPLKGKANDIFGYLIIVNDETEKHRQAEETKEILAKLKAVVGTGDSLMWEYDVRQDKMHVDLELRDKDRQSTLIVEPFKNKYDFYSMVYPEDREYVCEKHFERMLRGEINRFSIQYRRLFYDSYIWVRAYAQAYTFYEDGTPNKILYYLSNITEEVNLQDKLRIVENENRKIIEAFPDSLLIVDREARITNILTGQAENLIFLQKYQVGRKIEELLPPKSFVQLNTAIQATFEVQREHETGYWLTEGNVQKYFYVRIIPFDKQRVMVIMHDVTEKIQTEATLNMLGFAVSQSQDEIYAMATDGRMVFANRRLEENYQFEDPLTNHYIWEINPVYEPHVWGALTDSLRQGESIVRQSVHYPKNRAPFPVEIYVYRVENAQQGELYWCFARDITERVQQEQKIVSLNTLMNTILNNVPVAIIVKNIKEDFKILYFNTAAETFANVKAGQALGKTDFEIFPQIQRAWSERKRDEQTVKEGQFAQYAVEYITPAGEIKIVNEIRVVIDNIGGEDKPLLIALMWDITDQQQQEMELIKAREADKLKSAFLANMSHEIRTPLNAIVGFSGILAETEDMDERKSYLDIINKNNELLLQLINDILDFSKIESGKLDFYIQPVDLKEICEEAYAVHRLKVGPDVVFQFGSDKLPSIVLQTDAKRVTQVISNFMTNAIKFTSAGFIQLYYEIQGDWVRIAVRDSGMGISKADCENIFDRFVKLNDFKQGTGLGLPICKMIVEHLGGEIGVKSELNQGSEFWFKLPLQKAEATEISMEPIINSNFIVNPGKKDNKKHTILIAEDVEENYYLLKILLGKVYTLYYAKNGKEAVNLYQKYQPELILMDIKMPVMDGFEATMHIRTLSKDVPILALTAFAFDTEKQKAEACGFNGYIVKPIDINYLKKMISEYWPEQQGG